MHDVQATVTLSSSLTSCTHNQYIHKFFGHDVTNSVTRICFKLSAAVQEPGHLWKEAVIRCIFMFVSNVEYVWYSVKCSRLRHEVRSDQARLAANASAARNRMRRESCGCRWQLRACSLWSAVCSQRSAGRWTQMGSARCKRYFKYK